MIRICREALDIDVIAAGVRAPQHRRLLQKLDCTLAQGLLFGPARPAREIEHSLRAAVEETERTP
ncbi:MAG: hypothetical protein R2724_19940 [Bryobacterales bacterium]